MSTSYLLNAINYAQSGIVTRLRPGKLIDDAVFNTSSLIAAGAQLWPSSDATVAAGAAACAVAAAKGANDSEMESIMRGAVDEANRASGGASNIGITDTAKYYGSTNVEAALAELPTQGKVRAVATSIGTYTSTGGVLTAAATGAMSAQDGVTLVAGDGVLLPAGLTNVAAGDEGPWSVTDVGTSTTAMTLTRPGWWRNGSAVIPGREVTVSGEGTLFPGTKWRSMAAKAKVVGTDSPALYPGLVMQQVTLSTGAATVTNVPIFKTTSLVRFDRRTPGGTLTSTVQYNASTVTAGALGTASATVQAQIATGGVQTSDTSVGVLSIQNFT